MHQAHSKWTEFNLKLMGIGLGTMLISLFIIFLAMQRVNNLYMTSLLSPGGSGISFELIFAFFVVAIRACSFLSNSYICKFPSLAFHGLKIAFPPFADIQFF
jgi:phosphatidylinositol glycan class O